MKTLHPRIVEAIMEVLALHPRVQLAILFGSAAARRQNPESDIDLAVEAGQVLTTEDKMSLIEDLSVKTGRPIDLIDLRKAGEPLLGQVLVHGFLIKGSKDLYAALIRKHLFDAADFLPYRNRILKERRRAWTGR